MKKYYVHDYDKSTYIDNMLADTWGVTVEAGSPKEAAEIATGKKVYRSTWKGSPILVYRADKKGSYLYDYE